MITLGHLLAISAGASIGAICRWLLGLGLNHAHAFLPWGTLAANLLGGYLIGLALGALQLVGDAPEWLKLLITTGFLGGLTTFSTFSAETVGLLQRGSYLTALVYAVLSLVASLALTALGLATVQGLKSL